MTKSDIAENIKAGTDLSKNHILLDNGAFTRERPHFGNLVALNLETNDLIIQLWCDDENTK